MGLIDDDDDEMSPLARLNKNPKAVTASDSEKMKKKKTEKKSGSQTRSLFDSHLDEPSIQMKKTWTRRFLLFISQVLPFLSFKQHIKKKKKMFFQRLNIKEINF